MKFGTRTAALKKNHTLSEARVYGQQNSEKQLRQVMGKDYRCMDHRAPADTAVMIGQADCRLDIRRGLVFCLAPAIHIPNHDELGHKEAPGNAVLACIEVRAC